MKSLKRGSRLITLMISVFIIGMIVLIAKIQMEASFYISNSGSRNLGYIYDRNGDIIFDDNAENGQYPDGYFKDLGNLIGDASGQMTNTLVAKNLEKLSNYSFTSGITYKGGKAAIYSTLSHEANEAVYSAFGDKDGCAIAYNYKTGEILVCVSRPSVDPLKGYEDLAEGSLLCKAFYKTVPGSTQKIATLISAVETMGMDALMEKSFTCNGVYTNNTGLDIVCHNEYGHGTQNIREAFANSCNPFFAQLVEDSGWSLSDIEDCYKKLGYSVNGSEETEISIDGIISSKDHVTNVNGRTVENASTNYSEQLFSSQTASEVKDIMLENGLNYTGKIPGYTLGIKSGTAQVKDGKEENSLLTGFVDDKDFPIAFAILIENRESYDVSTEYIASVILDSLS